MARKCWAFKILWRGLCENISCVLRVKKTRFNFLRRSMGGILNLEAILVFVLEVTRISESKFEVTNPLKDRKWTLS